MMLRLNVPTKRGVVLSDVLFRKYDNFTDGDPAEFLRNLNAHMPGAADNRLIFIEKTGHTYQMKHQEVADAILRRLQEWRDA